MTPFVLACAGLILLSALFYALPWWRRRDESEGDSNLAWYRLRQQELADSGDEALDEDARLRLLEDDSSRRPVAASEGGGRDRFHGWLLLPLVAVAAVWLYRDLGAAPDVRLTERLEDFGANPSPEAAGQLMADVEARLAEHPDNLYYASLLAQYYMSEGDYRAAAHNFDLILEQAPDDPQVMAYAAQARYLAAERVMDDDIRSLARQAVLLDPQQRTALGMLGIDAFEQGDYRQAIQHWEQLLALETPGSEGQQLLAGVIADARSRLGEPATEDGTDDSTDDNLGGSPAAVASAGVTVTINLPADVALNPDDTVFVFARDPAASSRMPIAVERLRAAQLPLTLRLDDSNSMAGQSLAAVAQVVVSVQVSPSGQPGAANATWTGQSEPLKPALDDSAVTIELSPNS